ncbi:hypothetical protein OJ997_02985 [Solirubrobacter phytolaccae]|uniref:Uncharacterized protein n=1 Tax=Solirubrobacter phytolaccae TaxID=1404360 RepID=A0A9X3N418_9ACTN|nr:hypothetical protein [Solirubrobacter phytolaccae]MDA0179249.1 hypothetical protein [Solirubrobacter phytolaccae]
MTAIAAPTTLRPGWLRAFWVTLWGLLAAGVAVTLLRFALTDVVQWPDPLGRAPGVGWPWRIEGPWSLAADIGPALLFGCAFAWPALSVVSADTTISPRRAPTVVVATGLALVVWHDAYIQLNLLAIVPLTLVVRHEATRPRRPLRRRPLTIGLVAVAAVALATATVSYGRVNALSAEWGPVSTSNRGHEYLTIPLRGLGPEIVNLESVRVPGRPEVVIRAWNWIGNGVGGIDGLSIFAGETRTLALRMPQGCSAPIRVDRLDVHMKVGDREHHQVVRLGWLRDVPCG